MAKNDFKPFATGAGANVMSQAEWEALAALLTGFQAGKAASAQVNKALRQGTVMASVIGQFIADSTGMDVLDNGNSALVLTNFIKALNSNTVGRLLNVRVITSSGTYTPTPGTKKIRVKIVGGGGGGGGAAANTSAGTASIAPGGFGGVYGETTLIDATSISSVSVTVGSAGAGVTGASGTDGGTSSFGSYIIAPGGKAGGVASSSTSGSAISISVAPSFVGCTGSAVLFSIPGGAPGFALALGTTEGRQVKGGDGGPSAMGTGGTGLSAGNTPVVGAGYGAGGAGACATYVTGTGAVRGGYGLGGLVIVEEYA